jgi:hypothetical protein
MGLWIFWQFSAKVLWGLVVLRSVRTLLLVALDLGLARRVLHHVRLFF